MPTFARAWRGFSLPKEGHTEAEYEDAFAGDADSGRFAVADGASESAFAAAWAGLLVNGYVHTPGAWSGWLPSARERWLAEVHSGDLPWYAETKLQEGAYATLLGLAFHRRQWRAEAVGDSCLFVVREQGLACAFPVRRASDFGNQPPLLGSRRLEPGQARVQRRRLQGAWQPGDLFFLMTDALAQWFLKEAEEDRQPWEELQAIASQPQFARLLARLRSAREVRNDDVTLICLQIASS